MSSSNNLATSSSIFLPNKMFARPGFYYSAALIKKSAQYKKEFP